MEMIDILLADEDLSVEEFLERGGHLETYELVAELCDADTPEKTTFELLSESLIGDSRDEA